MTLTAEIGDVALREDPSETSFWNCSFSYFEIAIMGTALAITFLLQLESILNSAIALPLLGILAFTCWLTPVTSFFYIAASQSLPFPQDATFNPAQLGAMIWLVVFPIRYGLPRFKSISLL